MENHKLFLNQDHDNTMFPNFGIDFANYYFDPNWDGSADQGDPFESALSSMVSSPAATPAPGDGTVIRELIGRLGSICSSGTRTCNANSTNTSCYNTPMSSPPRLSPASQCQIGRNFQVPPDPVLAAFSTNPGFVERAARYSCLGTQNDGHSEHPNRKLSRCSSSVSEQNPNEKAKKRKSVAKEKGKTTISTSVPKTDPKVAIESDELSAKKRKGNGKEKKSGSKASPGEPPKDYIHVRARRGQATDSHSLAERVRREKISEKMKFLQDLVPGCDKVTGKAVMLDEIINYVQSLQQQVEFLSMKLTTVNPQMEFNSEVHLPKDVFQTRRSISQNTYSLDPTFPYGYQSPQVPFPMPSLNPALHRNTSMQFPSIDGFSEAASRASAWEDDLHSIVQMRYGPNQQQNFQNGTGHMKLEL